MKQCTRCRAIREKSEFRKQPQNRDGLQSHCKYCQNASKEEWRKKNIVRVRAHARDFYKKNPVRAKGRLIQKYLKGNSWEQCWEIYQTMLNSQNHTCAICKRHDSKRALHIDHCHKTGNVRGLLCHNCNLTLGRMDESIENLISAAEYLKKHLS